MSLPEPLALAPGPGPGEQVADPTLLDTLAAMTPEERLRWNDVMARTIQELRDGFASTRPDHPARAPRSERD